MITMVTPVLEVHLILVLFVSIVAGMTIVKLWKPPEFSSKKTTPKSS